MQKGRKTLGLEDLRKVIHERQILEEQRQCQHHQQQDSPQMRQLIQHCRNAPFWRWGDKDHKTIKGILVTIFLVISYVFERI
jgi:hypothetical protein